MKKLVERIVDASGRHALAVLVGALVVLVSSWFCASHLEIHSELLELLPRDSPGFRAFEHQLGRTGGNSSLLVIVESPSRAANERFVDRLSAELEAMIAERAACLARARGGDAAPCGPELISYVESGTKDVRAYFEANKWLYADLDDLETADRTLDHEIAIRSGLVPDLDDDSPDVSPGDVADTPTPRGAPRPPPTPPRPPRPPPRAGPPPDAKPALGLDAFYRRWKEGASRHDDFPTGYFTTPDGKMMGLRIVSPSSGMGDRGSETLLTRVKELVKKIDPATLDPQMLVGYGGDIPNAIEEKDSLVSDAAWASGVAAVLILGGIVFFFRSPWSLPVIALPVLIGVGCAYTFAEATYGYVNTTGAFLGAIILGNGINYPIVLLARYREFRARGEGAAEARRNAVWNAFRAELVGACVGSIAYGSLVITRFRGFNQFGMIGFVGMLLVWLSMIPCMPAMLVAIDWIQARLPAILRDPAPRLRADGSHGPVTGLVARATERVPWLFLTLAAVATVLAASRLPAFLRDPWEYDFVHLGSKAAPKTGAGEWSNKADVVFGGKMNVAGALMLADHPSQVPLIKAKILSNDAADPKGRLIADVATVEDLLPGGADLQKKKLEALDRIRDRLTPRVVAGLSPDEQARVREMRPPDTLKLLGPADLPALLRRRFEENDGRVGTVFYVRYRNDISLSDGRNLLRIAQSTDDVELPDGTRVETASRATVFAEMIRSMMRDGPLATAASFLGVVVVVIIATANLRGALAVILVLVLGVVWSLGGAVHLGTKLNFLNFIALPITFGIGCEYPFNVYDRTRILKGDITAAVKRTGGAVALCSYTTTIGYGSLLFADNQAVESFGRLAMGGEVACLLAALLVLPALLHVASRWWKRGAPPSSDQAGGAPGAG